jgi:hypothetical protein
MNCLKCGGTYIAKKQKLVISDKYVGPISIENASYSHCEKCNEKLFPIETARRIDNRRREIIHEYLQNQPINAFLSASGTASFLEISRQALHKHKRIRKGFIYSTLLDDKVVYLRKSVEQYKKRGDGRFDISFSKADLNLKQFEWHTELFKTPGSFFLPASKVTSIYPTAYDNLMLFGTVTYDPESTSHRKANTARYIIAADNYDRDTISNIPDQMDISFQTGAVIFNLATKESGGIING